VRREVAFAGERGGFAFSERSVLEDIPARCEIGRACDVGGRCIAHKRVCETMSGCRRNGGD